MNIQPILTPLTQLFPWEPQDSTVYKSELPTWNKAIKMYSWLQAKHLKSYAKIQNRLAKKYSTEIVCNSDSIEFNGELISKICISILKIPEESYSASMIDNQQPVQITTPKFIGGENLWEVYLKSSQRFKNDIDKIFEQYTIRFDSEIYFTGLSYENMKASIYPEWILNITITDISSNIGWLLMNNRK